MTSADKKQRAQEIAEKGKMLISKAEALLQHVVVKNSRLNRELAQMKIELEEHLAQSNKQ